jgi:Zn-dependent protease
MNEALVKYGDYRTSGEREIRPVLFRTPALVLRDFFDRRAGFLATSTAKKDIATIRREDTPGEEESAPAVGGLKLSLDDEIAQDIGRYRKHADKPAGMGHVVLRLALLIATLLGFTALFGRGHPQLTIAMLLGLIFVHEFGHWVMMKLFGYQRMGRFFVPFIGPIHLGRKLNASPWQQMMVILAGPLPGMLFGLGVMIAGFVMSDLPAWLRELGGLALALNAFHLLPFLPLDGGKMVDLLIFRDLPLLRPLFTIVSAAATFAASFPLKSRALRVIAVAMFTGIAWDIKVIGMVRGGRRIDWAGTVDDENEALQRIFRGIREEDNVDFLRRKDWQQKIDILLAEVMRKRPSFGFRFLAGGVYWWSFMLSVGLIGLLFMTKFIGSAGQLPTLAKHVSEEFRGSFPIEERPLTEEQFNAIKDLVKNTRDAIAQKKGSPQEQVALLTPELAASVDKLDWTVAGIALHCDEIDSSVLAVWLESQCSKMEAAVKSGQHAEGLRRAEILLHGVSALEPLRLLDFREPAWNAQLRTLTVVDQLAASGKLDAATLQRLEARVNALNKAPAPNVECLLLVASWSARQAESAMVDAIPDDGKEPVFDARFWNLATPQMLRLFDNAKSFGKSMPATVAVARHWKKTSKVGEIPPKLEGSDKVSPAPGESEFIAAFCEKQCQVTWRRLTTLSALKMESYRLKSGKLPDNWKYAIPGGGALSLDKSTTPCLKLVDQRKLIQPAPFPDWMGPMQNPGPIEYTCPLNPAPELSKK